MAPKATHNNSASVVNVKRNLAVKTENKADALPSEMNEVLRLLKSIPRDLVSVTRDSNPFGIINSRLTADESRSATNIIIPYFVKFADHFLELHDCCLYKMERVAVVPVVDKEAIYLAVLKKVFPKYPSVSSDDEWRFLTIRTPTGVVQFKEVTDAIMEMLETPTFHSCLANRCRKEKLASRPFPHFDPIVASLLRPSVTNAVAATIKMRKHTPKGRIIDVGPNDLPSFLRYPYLISGESGSGKTVASLQLADLLEKRAQEHSRRKRPTESMPAVLAIYKVATNEFLNGGVLAGVAEAIASAVAWGNTCEGHIEKSLANILIYVVLDEMGEYKDAVRTLVGEYGQGFQNELSKALTKKGREFTLDPHLPRIPIVLSIVGTGVGYPDSQGSIGGPYHIAWVVTNPSNQAL